jgi:hypothetical protein
LYASHTVCLGMSYGFVLSKGSSYFSIVDTSFKTG